MVRRMPRYGEEKHGGSGKVRGKDENRDWKTEQRAEQYQKRKRSGDKEHG